MWHRIRYGFVTPIANVVVGVFLWLVIRLVFCSPLFFLAHSLPPPVTLLLGCGAVFLALMLTAGLRQLPSVQFWKTRDGSKTLGQTRRGDCRHDAT